MHDYCRCAIGGFIITTQRVARLGFRPWSLAGGWFQNAFWPVPVL
jgi:hypothetical protein